MRAVASGFARAAIAVQVLACFACGLEPSVGSGAAVSAVSAVVLARVSDTRQVHYVLDSAYLRSSAGMRPSDIAELATELEGHATIGVPTLEEGCLARPGLPCVRVEVKSYALDGSVATLRVLWHTARSVVPTRECIGWGDEATFRIRLLDDGARIASVTDQEFSDCGAR